MKNKQLAREIKSVTRQGSYEDQLEAIEKLLNENRPEQLQQHGVSGKRPSFEELQKLWADSTCGRSIEQFIYDSMAACANGGKAQGVSDGFKDCALGHNLRCKCEGECDY